MFITRADERTAIRETVGRPLMAWEWAVLAVVPIILLAAPIIWGA